MTSKAAQSVSRAGVLVGGVAIALVVVAAAMAMLTVRRAGVGELASPVPSESVSGLPVGTPEPFPEAPLPVPPGNTIVEVLDPAVAAPPINADEAVVLARTTMGGLVGASPYVQLIRTTADNPTSRRNGWTGWIILSTDVQSSGFGGGYRTSQLSLPPSVPPAATFTWVWVGLDGEVLGATQFGYLTEDEVPPLPDD